MSAADHATLDCNLLVQAAGQDAAGGALREPYSLVQACVPILVDERGGDNHPRNGKATQYRRIRAYLFPELLDPGVTVTTRMRIEVLSQDGQAVARALVVESVSNPNSLDRFLELDCSEQPV